MPNGTTNGSVYLFDPTFCAVGHAASGSYLGTGDHWIGTGGVPVTTEFRLWDTPGTPYTTSDDVPIVETGNLFRNLNQVDKGSSFAGNRRYSDGGYDGASSADCAADPYHNKWYLLRDRLGAGIYRLQVWTSNDDNSTTNAENMFGVQAISNVAGARIYGQERMAAYNNLDGASAIFYLAQVDPIHAGKTLQIRLFDPGDVGGSAFLRIKRPSAAGYVDATFDFVADGGTGPARGNGVTELRTATSGTTLYNNAWITITIPLPSDYGSDGITPPGETQRGWWKIEYEITRSGNDTTTWEVSVRGNPVHLVVP